PAPAGHVSSCAHRLERRGQRVGSRMDAQGGVRARTAGRRAAPARSVLAEFSERPRARVRGRVPHARRHADAAGRTPAHEDLLRRDGDVPHPPCGCEPRLPWRTLSDGRPRRLDRGVVLGLDLLARRAAAGAPRGRAPRTPPGRESVAGNKTVSAFGSPDSAFRLRLLNSLPCARVMTVCRYRTEV